MAAKEYSSYNGISELRHEYEHFDKYLLDKQLSDDLILQAYKYEIKKFRRKEEIKIDLEDEFLDKNASDVLFLVRDLINTKKSERTAIYIGALKDLTGASNWKGLNSCFNTFKDYTIRINHESLNKIFPKKIKFLQHDFDLGSKEKGILSKFLLLKLFTYMTQNGQSPLLEEGLLQEGMLENESKLVSKSTFNRSSGCNDRNKVVLRNLLKILENYKNDIDSLIKISCNYKLNYNSSYIKQLKHSENIAIKIPMYNGVDYDAVLKKANIILANFKHTKTTSKIDLDKVILFLFLVKHFEYSQDSDRYSVSSSKFSKFMGDPKVVSSIRDAFEKEGVFNDKLFAKPEVTSNLYIVSVPFDIDTYKAINNAYLIHKLNHRQTIILGSDIEYKLELLNNVADVINSKAKTKPINLTQVFLKSGMTSPLVNFLNIINALKSRLKEDSDNKGNQNLINAFSDIDGNIANKLYNKLYNRLLGLLNNDQIKPNFIVPILDIISNEKVNQHLEEKFTASYLTKNPDEIDDESKKIRKELQEINNAEFIDKLKILVSFDEDVSMPF